MFTAHPTEAARPTTLNKLRFVADLLDDREARTQLSNAGRFAVESRYSISAVVDELLDQYTAALAPKPRARMADLT